MNPIYIPKGAAGEYAPLACNLWTTCSHGCKYCYVPKAIRKAPQEFFQAAPHRKDILLHLERQLMKMKGEKRTVLLSFTCDPYQPHDEKEAVTRRALEMFEYYKVPVSILTKGGMRAVRDFDILKRCGWHFGTTLYTENEFARFDMEPGAASNNSRVNAIKMAYSQGIFTWVSVEPVFNPESTLLMIENNLEYVNFWNIGKLNHDSAVEKRVDWISFIEKVRKLLNGRPYYIKNDLRKEEK